MSQSMCQTGAAKGIDTMFVLHPLAANEMPIMGISSGQLIGFTANTIAYDPLDKKIAGSLPGDMTYDQPNITLYLRPGTEDQEDLRMLAADQIQFNDLWLKYARKGKEFTHFQALDLASDPCGTFSISGWSHQSFSRSDLKQVQFVLSVADGTVAEYDKHTDKLQWTLSGGVLTADDADFTSSGFKVGMSIIYETGIQATPFGYGLVAVMTDTTLTLTNTTLNVAAGEGQIHAARIHFE